MIRGNNYTFATSKASHSFECFDSNKIFYSPSGGASSRQTRKGLLFLYPCVEGKINTSAQDFKATTGGRNKVAKCSPKEKSTLPRRPILQEYFSRLTHAVIDVRTFETEPVQSSKTEGMSKDKSALLILNRMPNQ